MSNPTPKKSHRFTASWRWPDAFETWASQLIDGYTVNICAGLSPLGDVRVDMMSPVEIISLLQADENTSLSDARSVFTDLLPDHFIGRDVIQELYYADDPTTHELASNIDTSGCLKTDVFDDQPLPFDTDTFDWTICDPPWKDLPADDRQALFDELVRITKPGGHILFNAWWIPTHESVTLDVLRFRKDDDRHQTGTPNLSYASIFTVFSSPAPARYLSQTFTSREFTPEPTSLKEAHKAATAYKLEQIDGVSPDAFDLDAVGPDSSQRCPYCGCRTLTPAASAAVFDSNCNQQLYECPNCSYPVTDAELAAISRGEIQWIRYENGWSTIHPDDLDGIDPRNPPPRIRDTLENEPGISQDTVLDYLSFATSGIEAVEICQRGVQTKLST